MSPASGLVAGRPGRPHLEGSGRIVAAPARGATPVAPARGHDDSAATVWSATAAATTAATAAATSTPPAARHWRHWKHAGKPHPALRAGSAGLTVLRRRASESAGSGCPNRRTVQVTAAYRQRLRRDQSGRGKPRRGRARRGEARRYQSGRGQSRRGRAWADQARSGYPVRIPRHARPADSPGQDIATRHAG
jgi:hypothetical protein